MTLFTSKLVAEVQQIIDSAMVDGRHALAWATLKGMFLTAKIGWYQRVRPENAAISKWNRGKRGVVGTEAQHHGDEVLGIGWTDERARDNVAMQWDGDESDAAFDSEQCVKSNGLIPELDFLMAAVLGGNHTTVFCRQVNGKVLCVNESLKKKNGGLSHLDKDTLGLGQPDFLRACSEGMMYFMIHKDAAKHWPSLPDFLQRALNITAENKRSELEVWFDMVKFSETYPEGAIDWDELQDVVAKTLPACAPYIPAMAEYLKAFGGSLLWDLDQFLHAFPDGCLAAWGGEFINSIVAGLKVRPGALAPVHVANALLKAQKISPKVVDGICRTIKSEMVQRLGAKAKESAIAEVERAMKKARDVVRQLQLANNATIAVGQFDVRCVVFLLGLKTPFEQRDFGSVAEIEEDHFMP